MKQEHRATAGNRNTAEMLWRAASLVPGKLAVVERERAVTYAELRDRAAAVADALRATGVEPGDRVVILLERGADAVAAYFGVLALGGVAVVVNELLRPRQVEYVLEHSGAKVLLSSEVVRGRLHRAIVSQATMLPIETIGSRAAFETAVLSEADTAQITFTSGSTGMPKGVVASHGNIWAAIETVAGYLGIEEHDRIVGMLPISGVYGANQMLSAVLRGATLLIPKSPIMNQVAAELCAMEATVLAAVPPLWMQLLQAPGFTAKPIESLRILQNAGGHLSPAAVRRIREVQPQAKLFLQYGLTEVFRSTYLAPSEVDARPGCMGRAIPGAELLVVREDGTLCDNDEVGELVHSGPTVTQGYWNDPVRTAEVFRPHPIAGPTKRAVYSGDLVRRTADGYFYFVGRRDRMIKTLGYRVGPDEILDVLYASGQIREGLVTAREDADRGQRIIAYVVLKEGGTIDALKKFCRTELPRYMHPNEFAALTELPKLPNGKHDLFALHSVETQHS